MSAASMILRRSPRSAIAPAGRDASSQGRVAANDAPAISAGLAVVALAIRSSATLNDPSARLESVLPVSSTQYLAPMVGEAASVGAAGVRSMCFSVRLRAHPTLWKSNW
jgi:hypothetical protein